MFKTEGSPVFKFLYEKYWDKLYVIARKRLDSKLDAEEVIQDIFCNLWRKRFTLEITKGFDNYLAVAVKFEVINKLAKTSRLNKFKLFSKQKFADFSSITEDQIDYNELQKKFQITVNALPEKCRIVFKLQYEEGLSQQQIADKMEISTKTVEAHLSKARKTLKNKFGPLSILFF